MPPSKLVLKQPKSCGRVLISNENIQQKEEKKKAALKEKEELQREVKKLAAKNGKTCTYHAFFSCTLTTWLAGFIVPHLPPSHIFCVGVLE